MHETCMYVCSQCACLVLATLEVGMGFPGIGVMGEFELT